MSELIAVVVSVMWLGLIVVIWLLTYKDEKRDPSVATDSTSTLLSWIQSDVHATILCCLIYGSGQGVIIWTWLHLNT